MFQGWDNYFTLLGTASGGLIGLLFVVVTLTAGFERSRALMGAALYLTPTAFHFAAVLVSSAIALAPRLPPVCAAAVLGLAAAVGLIYAARAVAGIMALRRNDDPPHWSDLWCYGAAPTLAYGALAAVAAGVWVRAAWPATALAVITLFLLLLAIRNAWDLITWMTSRGSPEAKPDGGG